MKNKSQNGFIPLIAMILFGIIAIAGGTVAAVSIQHNKPNEIPVKETPSTVTSSASVSAQDERPQVTTTSITKQKPIAPVKLTATTTSTEQSTPPQVDSTSTPVIQAPVPENPYKDSLAAIDAFLANQTPSSLTDLCTKAKNLPGTGSHEGLNGDKTAVIQIPNSLYSNIWLCEIVLGKSPATKPNQKYPFAWFVYSDSYLLPPQANSSDTDAMRITIIKDTDKYNEKIKSFIGSKMVYFDSSSGLVSNDADVFVNVRPDDTAKLQLERVRSLDRSSTNLQFLQLFLGSFVSMEQMLNEIKAKMIK